MVLTHFMVAKDHRGGAIALALLAKGLEFALVSGINVAVCESEPHLLPYYRRMGFRPYRPMYSDPNYPVILPLVLLGTDRAYLQLIGWPLLGMLPDTMPTDAAAALLEIVAGQETALSTDCAAVAVSPEGIACSRCPRRRWSSLGYRTTAYAPAGTELSHHLQARGRAHAHRSRCRPVRRRGGVGDPPRRAHGGLAAAGIWSARWPSLDRRTATCSCERRDATHPLRAHDRADSGSALAAKLLLNVSRLLARKILERAVAPVRSSAPRPSQPRSGRPAGNRAPSSIARR